jgi:hypothetical protein
MFLFDYRLEHCKRLVFHIFAEEYSAVSVYGADRAGTLKQSLFTGGNGSLRSLLVKVRVSETKT